MGQLILVLPFQVWMLKGYFDSIPRDLDEAARFYPQAIDGRRISHRADLPPAEELDEEGFAVVELPYSLLTPTIFGRTVPAEPFRPGASSEVGIIIADGIDGDFVLDIDWIDACG